MEKTFARAGKSSSTMQKMSFSPAGSSRGPDGPERELSELRCVTSLIHSRFRVAASQVVQLSCQANQFQKPVVGFRMRKSNVSKIPVLTCAGLLMGNISNRFCFG